MEKKVEKFPYNFTLSDHVIKIQGNDFNHYDYDSFPEDMDVIIHL